MKSLLNYFIAVLLLLCAAALQVVPLRAASLADLRKEYSENWIIISQQEPVGNRSELLAPFYIEDDEKEDLQTFLGTGQMPFWKIVRVSEREAVERMTTGKYGLSVIIKGQQLQSTILEPLLFKPFRLFAIENRPGAYPIALRWEGKTLTGEQQAWGYAQGTGALRPDFFLSLEVAAETLLISEGDSTFGDATIDTLFLDGSIGREHALDTLGEIGFGVREFRRFSSPQEITTAGSSSFSAYLTQGANLRKSEVIEWMADRRRRLTIRRFADVPYLKEITTDLRQPRAEDVGALRLDLTSVPPNSSRPAVDVGVDEADDPLTEEILADIKSDRCNAIFKRRGERSDRFALIVGNASYHPGIGYLNIPVDDAKVTSRLFHDLGFDVFVALEATKATIEKCVRQATADAKSSDIAIFYYSGHGIQIEDRNYLVPIEARPGDAIKADLIPFEVITEQLRASSQTTLIFLDACRDNPISDVSGSGLAALGTTAVVDKIDPAANEYAVVFATAPNATASEGIGQSPFTAALLEEFGAQGVSVQEALVRISASVGRATQWKQVPFTRSSLRRVLYLNGDQTLDEIEASSRLKAVDAIQDIFEGSWTDGRRLALEAIPIDVTGDQAMTDFREATQALEAIRFLPMIDLQDDLPLPLTGVIGRNWKLALITPQEGPMEIAKIFDVKNGRLMANVPFISEYPAWDIKAFADSSDGRFAAVSANDGRIIVTDLEQGVVRTIDLKTPGTERNYSLDIEYMEFSPSGTLLMALTEAAGLKIYDTFTGTLVDSIETLRLANEDFRFSLAGNQAQFRFISDDQLCFSAGRHQSVKYPEPDTWDFFALGKYDIGNEEISNLLWTRTRWQQRDLECTLSGQYAFIGGSILSSTERFVREENTIWGLLDFYTGEYVVGEEFSGYGLGHISLDGTRILFQGEDTLSLYDVTNSLYLKVPRSFWPGIYFDTEVVLRMRGEALKEDSFLSTASAPPDSFKINIGFDKMLEDILSEVPPDERLEIDEARPRLRPLD